MDYLNLLGFREFLKVFGGHEMRLVTAQNDYLSFQQRKAQIELCIDNKEYVEMFLGSALDESSHFFRIFYENARENLRNSNFQFQAPNNNNELTVYSLANPPGQKWAERDSFQKWLEISSLTNWQLNEGLEIPHDHSYPIALSNFLYELNLELQQRHYPALTRSDFLVLESISATNENFRLSIDVDFPENFQEVIPLLNAESIEILNTKLGFVVLPEDKLNPLLGFNKLLFDPNGLYLANYLKVGNDQQFDFLRNNLTLSHRGLDHLLLTIQPCDLIFPFTGLMDNLQIFKNSQLTARDFVANNDNQIVNWRQYKLDNAKFVYAYQQHREQILKAETSNIAFQEIDRVFNEAQHLDLQNIELNGNIEEFFIN